MRLSIDEDASESSGPALRRLGHDALVTREAGNKGLSDPKQLAFAVRHRRVLVTCNKRDFKSLHEAWVVWSDFHDEVPPLTHPGILVVPNGSGVEETTILRVIDEVVRAVISLENQLLTWSASAGWQDLTAVSS